jgi:hypothetical protein
MHASYPGLERLPLRKWLAAVQHADRDSAGDCKAALRPSPVAVIIDAPVGPAEEGTA